MSETTRAEAVTDRLVLPFGFLLILCWLSLQGCYEPVEGCLDVQASNFDVDADEPCADCCEYPDLRLDFQHKYVKGERVENLIFDDSVYYDVNGLPFRLNSIRFFLSELHLVRADGMEVGIEDRLELGVWTESLDTMRVTVEDNYTIVDPAVFGVKEIGKIITSGRFDRLRFNIGLDETANRAVINAFPEEQQDHPLAEEEMYWDFDRGYIFNRIELVRDTVAGTPPTVLEIGTDQNLTTVELPIDFEALEGFNVSVTLRVDYNIWFRDINVKTDSESTLIQKIVANLADSFSLVAMGL